MDREIFSYYFDSPIGFLKLQTDNKFLLSVSFVEETGPNSNFQPKILQRAILQLKEYFNGSRKTFDLELAAEGTEFQKKVWNFVQEVEFGQTASYLDIAIKTGSEKNTRAVGMANGKNPIPIIIPCHRIIGSNKKLTGYAGGLERKRWLLHHELQYAPNKNQLF